MFTDPYHSLRNAEWATHRKIKPVWLHNSSTGYAITHHLTPPISMQNHHSVSYGEDEREMLPFLKVSPLASARERLNQVT